MIDQPKTQAASIARGVVKAAAASCVLAAALGLLYRSTLYRHIPVHPGDPYGIGDIYDLLFFLAVFVTAAATLALSGLLMLVPAWRNPRLTGWTSLTAIASAAGYWFLHPLV